MVFSSITFIFFFLPIVLSAYFLAEKSKNMKAKNFVLLVASVIFYSWGGIKYFLLLLLLSIINFFFGIFIDKSNGRKRKILLCITIGIDVLNLTIFKYLNFLAGSFKNLLSLVIGREVAFNIPEIALPIGISFFSFQIMSYVIDLYLKRVKVQHNFFDFLLYVIMFPQLVAGPIVRYLDLEREIKDRNSTIEESVEGIKRFIIGFSKKVFVANGMGAMADAVFSLDGGHNSLYAWVGAISYTLQIYYDFSAYSDMIGLGLIFGFHFRENFDYPYKSESMQEFWRRWHMSLSTWFRDYVYIPLGGNRRGKIRTYANLWVVFLLTGIWHGAAWQFIVWGIYHGFFIFVERLGLGAVISRLPSVLRHMYACIVVVVGWVFFRADNVHSAIYFIKSMFDFDFSNFKELPILLEFTPMYIFLLVVAIFFSFDPFLRFKKMKGYKDVRIEGVLRVGYLLLFALGVIYLSGMSYNPFIYFKF